jgi:uncharacterized protein YegP (UPF0339 family)
MRTLSSLISLALSFSTITAIGCAAAGPDEEYGQDESEASGAGTFTLWQSTDGQYRFNLKSGNGAVLLASEGYTSRTGAINGILSVQDNGVDPLRYETATAAHGFVVHLLAGNGAVIGTTEVYASKSSATRAIGSTVKAVTSYLDKREAARAGTHVDVLAGATGQFHFSFFAGADKIVLTSESYTTEAAAYNGAYAVQVEGQRAAAYTVKQNAAGAFYLTIQARNGEIIAVSQAYPTQSDAEYTMTALIKMLPSISVL